MKILLTNDDGIHAPGINALYDELSQIGEVVVVAPDSEKSAVGHAITLNDPLRATKFYKDGKFFGYAIKGTPADCVKLGYWAILKEEKPDLLVSGINLGSNAGINTNYSGTVSAATEGAMLGISSFAISLTTFKDPDFGPAARFARRFVPFMLEKEAFPGIALNVNFPAVPEDEIQGIRVTRQGQAMYREEFEKRIDPHGRTYYWLTGEKHDVETDPEVDDVAIDENCISITPIHFDLTHYQTLDKMKSWSFDSLMSHEI